MTRDGEPMDGADTTGQETDERAVYIISVAAELAGVHPQTLRIYERKGLLRPKRTQGNTRRYSPADVQLLRMIQSLTQDEGVNLAGVKRIMELRAQMEELQRRVRELQEELSHRRAIAMPGRRSGSEIEPVRTVVRLPWHERGVP
jgi:MerR family transcriptional regulator/heat shock protein HspR